MPSPTIVPAVTATSTTCEPHALFTVPMSTPWSSDQSLGGRTRDFGYSGNTHELEAEPVVLNTADPFLVIFLSAVYSTVAVLTPTDPLAGRSRFARWKARTAAWVIGPKVPICGTG